MDNRNHYFDFLRGIAIMMVVGIHTFAKDEVDMSRALDANAFVRETLNCAVPMFLAISGFFLSRKPLDNWDERKAFWKRQMPKVYIPTLLVSLPYFALDLYRGESPILSLMWMFICGYSIYYFIALILQYYALLPLFQRVNRVGGVIILSIVSLVCAGICAWLIHIKGVILPLLAYAGPFPLWCVFFGLGCYLRKRDRGYSLIAPIVLVIIGSVLQYAECHWLNSLSGVGFGIKMSAWVYSIAVILLLFSARLEQAYRRNAVNKFVEYVGNVSFTVYLYHLLVYKVLLLLSVNEIPWIGRWMVLMLASLVFVEVAKRILPKKIHWLIGATNQ